ncbi:thioredoxin [Christensenellaceae bacterium OttesenSCG-928-L17]|nr:thioredoxin [Christensenellaceae bacterium OttesenSCG-928-L17]
MSHENILELTKDNFDSTIASSEPVLVDFWATWCGPCRMIGPFIEELADEYKGKAKVGKVNVDEQPELAERYRVMTIPTVMVFKNGEIMEKSVGAKPKQGFADMIDACL